MLEFCAVNIMALSNGLDGKRWGGTRMKSVFSIEREPLVVHPCSPFSEYPPPGRISIAASNTIQLGILNYGIYIWYVWSENAVGGHTVECRKMASSISTPSSLVPTNCISARHIPYVDVGVLCGEYYGAVERTRREALGRHECAIWNLGFIFIFIFSALAIF
jgi:hypothetical protein